MAHKQYLLLIFFDPSFIQICVLTLENFLCDWQTGGPLAPRKILRWLAMCCKNKCFKLNLKIIHYQTILKKTLGYDELFSAETQSNFPITFHFLYTIYKCLDIFVKFLQILVETHRYFPK